MKRISLSWSINLFSKIRRAFPLHASVNLSREYCVVVQVYQVLASAFGAAIVLAFTGCGLPLEEGPLVRQQIGEIAPSVSRQDIFGPLSEPRTLPLTPERKLPASYSATPKTYPTFIESTLATDDGEYRQVAQRFASEITHCGIQAKNSNCLVPAERVLDSSTVNLSDSSMIFSVLAFDDLKSHFGLIIETDGKNPVAHIKKAMLVAVRPDENRADIIKNDYIFNRSRTILTINLAADNSAHAMRALAEENSDYRQYFYAMEYLMLYAPEQRTITIQAIRKYYELIADAQGGDAMIHQKYFLDTIRSKLFDEPELLRLVARRFLSIPQVKVQELASIILALLGETSDLIHGHVLSAVKTIRGPWSPSVIRALNNVRDGISDENAILVNLDNPLPEVRNMVARVIKKWTFTDGHVPALKSLANSIDFHVREKTVELTQRIQTDAASELLLELLDDGYSSIHTAAFNALNMRTLTNTNLPALEKIVNSSFYQSHKLAAISLVAKIKDDRAAQILLHCLSNLSSDIRKNSAEALEAFKLGNNSLATLKTLLNDHQSDTRLKAVKLVATIGTREALVALIPMLADIYNENATTVVSLLANFIFTNKEIPLLKELLLSGDWNVRPRALRFMASIGTVEAAEAIIPALDDSNGVVRKDAFTALSSLPVSPTMVPPLVQIAQSYSTEVLVSVAKILARIEVQSSTAALIDLAFHSSIQVREAALSALGTHPFSFQQVTSLRTSLENDSSYVREAAAIMLGLAGDCRALVWLINRQAHEWQGSIIQAIATSIGQLSHCQ